MKERIDMRLRCRWSAIPTLAPFAEFGMQQFYEEVPSEPLFIFGPLKSSVLGCKETVSRLMFPRQNQICAAQGGRKGPRRVIIRQRELQRKHSDTTRDAHGTRIGEFLPPKICPSGGEQPELALCHNAM